MIQTVSAWTWVVTLSALFGFRTVHGFQMTDMRTQVQQTDNLQQSTMTPAYALVNEVVRLLDTNNDGEVALSEFGARLDTRFRSDSVIKGYLLTVASIIDVDENGQINRNELHRAISKLMSLAGLQQIGRGFEILYSFHGFRNTAALIEYIALDFANVLDSDDDGLVSVDEIRALVSRPKTLGFDEGFGEIATNSDTNRDGYLNLTEARQFLYTLASDNLWILRHIYVYFRVSNLAGKLAADAWSYTGH
ncbi:uncharacterized protein LOC135477843 [Liolophura sinensis]|uniref:uncharacterized protein LOC135477843 n=1 Tax=Liolophura sinensis TaxID=3198878 RepID=UPI003158089F